METVLIVEDDPTMLRGLKDNFEFAGYNVLTAEDGEVALNTALNAKPNLDHPGHHAAQDQWLRGLSAGP